MTRGELLGLLDVEFYDNFAQQVAEQVVLCGGVGVLYELATDRGLSKKVQFRAAYILETIYFSYNELFTPYIERFFEDFSHCANESAKRHFCKIMAHLLVRVSPTERQCSAIAESCVAWISEPRTKIAVRIWALEVVVSLRSRVEWLEPMLPDIIEPLINTKSPAIACRIRRLRAKGVF